MNSLQLYFLALGLLTFSNTIAQNDIWYFGNKAGLSFNGGGVTSLSNSNMSASEACATLTDSNSSLLCYTNGDNIYDASHLIMQNGDNIADGLGYSASMGPILAPIIGKKSQYYIFSVGSASFGALLSAESELRYSIIDFSLPGNGTPLNPLGEVLPSKKGIIIQDSVSEMVTAIPHATCPAYWVITRVINKPRYLAYLIDSTGIDTIPVISDVGTHNIPSSGNMGTGWLEPSFDGKTIIGCQSNNVPQIFDFDAQSGLLSNARNMSNISGNWYGAAFSPNDSIIYLTRRGPGNAQLFAFERFASNIASSSVTVASNSASFAPYTGLQTGVDGKIYIATARDSMHIIENPNDISNPQLSLFKIKLGTYKNSGLALPNTFKSKHLIKQDYSQCNVIDSFDCDSIKWSISLDQEISICLNDTISIKPELSFPQNTYRFSWSTNDTSSQINIYSSGAYWLTLTDINGCSQSDTVQIFTNDCSTTDDLFWPNAFSPNSDGANDYWQPNQPYCNYEIYNRLGKLVFKSKTNEKWDGKDLNGQKLTGNYIAKIYCIEAEPNNSKSYIQPLAIF